MLYRTHSRTHSPLHHHSIIDFRFLRGTKRVDLKNLLMIFKPPFTFLFSLCCACKVNLQLAIANWPTIFHCTAANAAAVMNEISLACLVQWILLRKSVDIPPNGRPCGFVFGMQVYQEQLERWTSNHVLSNTQNNLASSSSTRAHEHWACVATNRHQSDRPYMGSIHWSDDDTTAAA